MKLTWMLALALAAAGAGAAWMMSQTEVITPAEASMHAATERSTDAPLNLPLADPRIVVKKGERRLTLFDGDRKVRVYRIGLGFAPVGDKVRQGDGRTPEGSFYVCVKNVASKFYRSLGLSYPNKEHAARGLRDGIVNRTQHDQIIRALANHQRPPWDTRLGGEIFIHGNGSSSDWTWGCVALDDSDMKELFEAVPKGASVVIEP
jgi:murein L,D-transpeptidase YafK